MSEKSTFEDNIKKLEETVRRLERGEITLEESLAAFEEGISLIRVCQQQLDQAAHKIQVLTEDGTFQELRQEPKEV